MQDLTNNSLLESEVPKVYTGCKLNSHMNSGMLLQSTATALNAKAHHRLLKDVPGCAVQVNSSQHSRRCAQDNIHWSTSIGDLLHRPGSCTMAKTNPDLKPIFPRAIRLTEFLITACTTKRPIYSSSNRQQVSYAAVANPASPDAAECRSPELTDRLTPVNVQPSSKQAAQFRSVRKLERTNAENLHLLGTPLLPVARPFREEDQCC